jgi:hypothetical protein
VTPLAGPLAPEGFLTTDISNTNGHRLLCLLSGMPCSGKQRVSRDRYSQNLP